MFEWTIGSVPEEEPVREPKHVIDDLGRKVTSDVATTIMRTVSLVRHPQDQLAIVTRAIAAAAGCYAGQLKMMGLPAEQGLPEVIDLMTKIMAEDARQRSEQGT